jgi:hypothetical protein
MTPTHKKMYPTSLNPSEEKMETAKKVSKILGVAFLLQFITSFFSGTVLNQAWYVAGNITGTMTRIAGHPGLMQANILVDMLTAFGIIFLGAALFTTLRNQNETVALLALGLYIVEAALLAASKLPAFALLQISQAFAAGGQPASLETAGSLALESMNFVGSTLHMLTFCLGGILFYTLLYRSRVIPRGLSLWGLIAVFPCLIATLFTLFGNPLPFWVYLPYVPFEFVVGVWILFRGIPRAPELKQQTAVLHGQP